MSQQQPKQRPMAGRVPVHDIEAEAAVLSACLLKNGVLDDLVGMVEPEEFYSPGNGKIFEAARSLRKAQKPVDVVTVASWLRERERLAEVGGIQYLTQIVDATPAVAHAQEHALKVRECFLQRTAGAMGHELAAESYGDVGSSVGEWIANKAKKLFDVAKAAARVSITVPIRSAIIDAFQVINAAAERANRNEEDPSPRTGLPDLDRLIINLPPGSLTVIAAPSHVGKSSLTRQIAAQAVRGYPRSVLFWTGEQLARECAEAMTFQFAGVAAAKLRTNSLRADEWRRLTDSASELSELKFWYHDEPAISPTRLHMQVRAHRIEQENEALTIERARAAAARRSDGDTRTAREVAEDVEKCGMPRPLEIVVVDYIQLMDGTGLAEKGANRERQVAEVVKYLKRMAMEERVAVIACSQVNEDGKARESKEIFNSSDKFIVINNPDAIERVKAKRDGSNYSLPEAEVAELMVQKCRGGGTCGTVRVTFHPQSGRFSSYRDENEGYVPPDDRYDRGGA